MFSYKALGVLIVQVAITSLVVVASSDSVAPNEINDKRQPNQSTDSSNKDNKLAAAQIPSQQAPAISSASSGQLEPRFSDRGLVKDILDRLHALDADIGKLLYNSTSMYAPDDQSPVFAENAKGGERFTEVLNDLDSLQDEIGSLITNATRSRQYNILVRLRPLNSLLYRIRHNLHLMRNSLVAVNAVSSLERLGNTVLDSTLQAFMKPDADLNEEIGDNGNYDFNLDKLGDNANVSTPQVPSNLSVTLAAAPLISSTSPATSTTILTTPSTTTTTTTTTTPPPPTSTTAKVSSTTRRAGQRGNTRRNNQRPSQRRTTQKPSSNSTTSKPLMAAANNPLADSASFSSSRLN